MLRIFIWIKLCIAIPTHLDSSQNFWISLDALSPPGADLWRLSKAGLASMGWWAEIRRSTTTWGFGRFLSHKIFTGTYIVHLRCLFAGFLEPPTVVGGWTGWKSSVDSQIHEFTQPPQSSNRTWSVEDGVTGKKILFVKGHNAWRVAVCFFGLSGISPRN